jgi:hypothetical protein
MLLCLWNFTLLLAFRVKVINSGKWIFFLLKKYVSNSEKYPFSLFQHTNNFNIDWFFYDWKGTKTNKKIFSIARIWNKFSFHMRNLNFLFSKKIYIFLIFLFGSIWDKFNLVFASQFSRKYVTLIHYHFGPKLTLTWITVNNVKFTNTSKIFTLFGIEMKCLYLLDQNDNGPKCDVTHFFKLLFLYSVKKRVK